MFLYRSALIYHTSLYHKDPVFCWVFFRTKLKGFKSWRTPFFHIRQYLQKYSVFLLFCNRNCNFCIDGIVDYRNWFAMIAQVLCCMVLNIMRYRNKPIGLFKGLFLKGFLFSMDASFSASEKVVTSMQSYNFLCWVLLNNGQTNSEVSMMSIACRRCIFQCLN